MKTFILAVSLAFAISGPGCSRTAAQADEHEAHEAHEGHAAAPVLPEGRLWPTDEPLRAAMLKIRAAVEQAAPAYERKELRSADAQALATAIEENVASMAANCRLAPDPDAALHVLIGRMMGAAAVLKNDPGSEAGMPQLVAVMHDYQTTFDHPGWSVHAH